MGTNGRQRTLARALRELGVAHRVGGGPVDRAAAPRRCRGPAGRCRRCRRCGSSSSTAGRAPGLSRLPPLPIGAAPPGSQLEDRRHDAQGPRAPGQHDPGPDPGHADAERLGRRAAASSHSRQTTAMKSEPEGLVFGQLLVAVRAVIADRRRLHEDLRAASSPCAMAATTFSVAVDAAVADLPLDLGVPALGEEVLADQVDDGVAAVELRFPAARDRGIALDDLYGRASTGRGGPGRPVATGSPADRRARRAVGPGGGRSGPVPPVMNTRMADALAPGSSLDRRACVFEIMTAGDIL